MKAPKITETAEHRTIASYFRKIGLGGGALAIHIRNERGSAWERMEAKRMGVLSGVPDWLILHNGEALFIELKPRGWMETKLNTGNFTDHERRQIETHRMLREAGCYVQVCETLKQVIDALKDHGVPIREESISAESIRKAITDVMKEKPGDRK